MNVSAAAPAAAAPDPKLMKVCRQFEGQFFNMMLAEMRKTVPDDTELGDDAHEQQIFTGMMDEHVAQEMADRGAPDPLVRQMYDQLHAAQKSAPASPPATAPAATAAGAAASAYAATRKMQGARDLTLVRMQAKSSDNPINNDDDEPIP